jgi:hypothetical protein
MTITMEPHDLTYLVNGITPKIGGTLAGMVCTEEMFTSSPPMVDMQP